MTNAELIAATRALIAAPWFSAFETPYTTDRARTLLPQLADALEQEHAEVVRLREAILSAVDLRKADIILSLVHARRDEAARHYFEEVKDA